MTDNSDQILCANPDCRVAETGRCIEGLDLESCAQYGHEAVVSEQSVIEEAESKSVMLPSSNAMNLDKASFYLRKGSSRVIAVLGPSDSGKTSLISSVYELFQISPIGDVAFVGSHTLHAFEMSCHDARSASRRSEPYTNRTPYGEVAFYHLQVGSVSTEQHTALLLADRAGEQYLSAASDISVVENFLEVHRADVLTILVDGGRLLDNGDRHNVISDTKMMLQGIIDGGGLKQIKHLALCLTKTDAVSVSSHQNRALEDFDGLGEFVMRSYETYFDKIEYFHLAASPKTNGFVRGTGVSSLLSFWLGPVAASKSEMLGNLKFNRPFTALQPISEGLEPDNE